MAGQLSTEQILLLNNLMYMDNDHGMRNLAGDKMLCGNTVGDIVNNITNPNLASVPDCGSFIDGKSWVNMINAIKSDPQLMNVRLVDSHTTANNGQSALFHDPSTNEAIVTFRGTGAMEWKDNCIAGGEMDGGALISPDQRTAMAWYESKMSFLDGCDTITVTGHSKGGNKAKLITLEYENVTRCLSFDGQGFSDEYFAANQDKIARNWNKIENHNCDYDFVNFLLNDVGETKFYKGQNVDSFIENHCPDSMFDFSSGKLQMHETARPESMAVLDDMFNKMIRNVSPSEKAAVLNTFGDVLQAFFDNNGDLKAVIEVATTKGNYKQVAYILSFMLLYQSSTGKLDDALMDMFKINKSFIGAIKAMLRISPFGLPLDIAGLIMSFISGLIMNKTSGADMTVTPQAAPSAPDMSDMGSIFLLVHPAELRAAANALLEAISQFEDASDTAREAAKSLISEWEGEACRAFQAEQAKYYAWCGEIIARTRRFANMLLNAATRYEQTEATASQIIGRR